MSWFIDPDSLGLEWVSVEGGELTMGANANDAQRYATLAEGGANDPDHTVSVTSFSLAKTETTNDQYVGFLNGLWGAELLDVDATGAVSATDGPFAGHTLAAVGDRGAISFGGDEFAAAGGSGSQPVVNVTWYGAAAFAYHCNLSLPTEAEWEFAARADFDYDDESLLYPTVDGSLDSTDANTLEADLGATAAVCDFPASRWGLCDLCGNVWEWVGDWYANNYYACSPYADPAGPAGTDEFWTDDEFREEWQGELYGHATKVQRGGAFDYLGREAMITARFAQYPYVMAEDAGFRTARRGAATTAYTPDSCLDDDEYEAALAALSGGDDDDDGGDDDGSHDLPVAAITVGVLCAAVVCAAAVVYYLRRLVRPAHDGHARYVVMETSPAPTTVAGGPGVN